MADHPRALPLLLGVYVLVMGLALSGHGWVWDDRALIVAGRLEPAGEALRLAWTQDFWALAQDGHGSGMYRPLTGTLYIVERALLGLSPGLAHLVNVLLHASVAGCVGLLARQLGGRAWIGAALVLLHPHAAELVGNVAARTDLLAALGVSGALVLRSRHPWGAATALLAGALCKEVALAGLPLWWALDAWEGRRPAWLPGLVAVSAALGLRLLVLGLSAGDGGSLDLLGAAASSGWALADVVLPLPAGPWPLARSPALGVGVAGLFLLLSALSIRRGWKAPLLLTGWVLLSWAPMAGWLPVEVRPSRALLYLPLLGVGLVGSLVQRRTPLLVLVLGMMAVGHGWVASRWSDPLTLWTWGVQRNAQEPLCHVNLGRAHAELGDFESAEVAYSQAAALAFEQQDATWFVPAATALGRLALERGDPEAARVFFQDAVNVGGEAAPEAQDALEALPL